ncbi:hypothetical protein [Streptomyces wuyuanensis]|uniref:hypothetical protein n=1 Tax=Streptomyces wuyuanensis TaxID=1196353 RepID=UPI00341921E9
MSDNEMILDGEKVTGITLKDGHIPNMTDGNYKVTVKQTVTLPPEVKQQSDIKLDTPGFTVRGPRFSLDPSMVHAVHPAVGATGDFSLQFPHIVISRDVLPWERQPITGTPRVPWVALMIFAQDELRADPATGDSATSRKVSDLASSASDAMVPGYTDVDVPTALKNSMCVTIDARSDAFTAIVPHRSELPFLAHVREIGPRSGREAYAVVMASRLPKKEGRYEAHLISLEALGAYLDGKKPDKAYVRLLSLHRWSFTAKNDVRHGFDVLARNLVRNNTNNARELSLSLSSEGVTNARVKDRLTAGYVPVSHLTQTGEQSFAWYRGPFTPVIPPEPSDKKKCYITADDALIYIADDGVFDVSYSAAFTWGRLLALADSDLAAPVLKARRTVLRHMLTLSSVLADLEATTPVPPADNDSGSDVQENDFTEELAAHLTRQIQGNTPYHQFGELVEAGLATRLKTSLTTPTPTETRLSSPARKGDITGRDLASTIQRPDVQEAFRRALRIPPYGPADTNVALTDTPSNTGLLDGWAWDTPSLLSLLPRDVFLPHAALVPPESLRLFHINPHWITALVDGITSVGISTNLDQQAAKLIRDAIAHQDAGKITGIILRSQLITQWPGFHFQAFRQANYQQPCPVIRRDLIAPDTLLLLLDGSPRIVELVEPTHEVTLGLDSNNTCTPRLKTGTKVTSKSVKAEMRDTVHNVVNIAKMRDTFTTSDLGWSTQNPITPSGFALQMMHPPCRAVVKQQ